ncbi:MAG: DNA repair protein RadA, partial [Muribaculaceae bacterium]|nr:DNA repair protein RadA [Muribaculaceae bacterium]
MAKNKNKTAWFCNGCGNESSRWEGRCPSCGAWNSMIEERVVTGKPSRSPSPVGSHRSRPVAVSDI